jgi:hypothetical protein
MRSLTCFCRPTGMRRTCQPPADEDRNALSARCFLESCSSRHLLARVNGEPAQHVTIFGEGQRAKSGGADETRCNENRPLLLSCERRAVARIGRSCSGEFHLAGSVELDRGIQIGEPEPREKLAEAVRQPGHERHGPPGGPFSHGLYSDRSATSGSTLAARRAGTKAATRPIAARSNETMT